MRVEKKVYITGYSLWHYKDKEGRSILSEDSDGFQTWRVYEGKEPVYNDCRPRLYDRNVFCVYKERKVYKRC